MRAELYQQEREPFVVVVAHRTFKKERNDQAAAIIATRNSIGLWP
jgi:hypothetical protein